MGTVFLEDKFDGQVNSVESYLQIKAEKVRSSDSIKLFRKLELNVACFFFYVPRDSIYTMQLGNQLYTGLRTPKS